jgi:hypothetical protein
MARFIAGILDGPKVRRLAVERLRKTWDSRRISIECSQLPVAEVPTLLGDLS